MSVDNLNGSVTVPEKVQAVEADAFDTSISVRIATEETASAISIDDIEVTADGRQRQLRQADGRPRQVGELRPVDRRSDRGGVPRGDRVAPGDRQGLGHRLALAPQKAYAAYDTPDTMATLPDVQFDNMDLDSLSIGEIFWYSANIMYYGEAGFNTDLRSYMCIPYQQSYGGGALDWLQQRRRIGWRAATSTATRTSTTTSPARATAAATTTSTPACCKSP